MSAPPIPLVALRDPFVFFATGFGAGLLRPAPGTWGSALALPFAWALSLLPLAPRLGLVLASAVIGVWICGRAAERLGVEDHGGIVWDEMAGIWFALALLPVDLYSALLAFGFFRLFDIAKPWPVSWADREVGGGLGVMLDDLIAGVLAGGATFLVLRYLPL